MNLRAGGHTGTSGESLLARGHQERQAAGKKQWVQRTRLQGNWDWQSLSGRFWVVVRFSVKHKKQLRNEWVIGTLSSCRLGHCPNRKMASFLWPAHGQQHTAPHGASKKPNSALREWGWARVPPPRERLTATLQIPSYCDAMWPMLFSGWFHTHTMTRGSMWVWKVAFLRGGLERILYASWIFFMPPRPTAPQSWH